MIGALLRKPTGLPVVSTVHSDYKLDYMGRPFARLTFGAINAWALRHLDYRIGVSDAMVDLLIDRGLPPRPVLRHLQRHRLHPCAVSGGPGWPISGVWGPTWRKKAWWWASPPG